MNIKIKKLNEMITYFKLEKWNKNEKGTEGEVKDDKLAILSVFESFLAPW